MKSPLPPLAAALALALPALASADLLDLSISGNITAYDMQGDRVFDSISSTTSLRVHWRNVNFLSQRWAYRSIIEVDLASLPSNAVIDSALLTLSPTQFGSSSGGDPSFDFYGYVGDGSLGLADAAAGDLLVQTVAVGSFSPFQVDFTAYLQTLVTAGEAYLGINIRAEDEGLTFNSFDEEFNSNGIQSGTPTFPGPVFSVDFHASAPLPGSAWLLAAGLPVLLRLRRSRRPTALAPAGPARRARCPAAGSACGAAWPDLAAARSAVRNAAGAGRPGGGRRCAGSGSAAHH